MYYKFEREINELVPIAEELHKQKQKEVDEAKLELKPEATTGNPLA